MTGAVCQSTPPPQVRQTERYTGEPAVRLAVPLERQQEGCHDCLLGVYRNPIKQPLFATL